MFDGNTLESWYLPGIGINDYYFFQSYIIEEEGTGKIKFGGFGPINTHDHLLSTIYYFENDSWHLEYQEMYGSNVSGGELGYINVLNNKFVRLFWERIETYQNGTWFPFMTFNEEIKVRRNLYFDGAGIMEGTGLNDFFLTSQVNQRDKLLHWNGEKFSIESETYSINDHLEAISLNESQLILLQTSEQAFKNYLLFFNKKQ